MAKPTLKTLQSGTTEGLPYIVDTVQANVGSVVNQLSQSGITDSVFRENVSIETNDTVVNHGLGRPPRGWIVVDKTGVGDVYRSSSNNPAPNQTMILKASEEVTASFMFF